MEETDGKYFLIKSVVNQRYIKKLKKRIVQMFGQFKNNAYLCTAFEK